MIEAMRALALVALALVPSAVAATPSGRVIDSDSVGAYRITESRERAIDVFGAPSYSVDVQPFNLPQPDRLYCRTAWNSLQLVIEYTSECKFATRVRRIILRDKVWRTREDLRVGDTVAKLRRLYRGARVDRAQPGGLGLAPLGLEWDLRRARPRSQVIVATREGRVVGFELRAASLR